MDIKIKNEVYEAKGIGMLKILLVTSIILLGLYLIFKIKIFYDGFAFLFSGVVTITVILIIDYYIYYTTK